MAIKLSRKMFQSARITLTLFYLVILVAFSLIVTFSIRILAEREYLQSNMEQRGQVRQIILKIQDLSHHWPNKAYVDWQEAQQAHVRNQLDQDMLLINMAALIVGGVLSYWFAGRTLKPIEEAHEAQARFAADASHELRTPLTNLKLENEVFLRQKHFNEQEARELIASNLEEVQRLEELSANLLALTQYGHTPLELQPVSVKQVVAAAVKLAKPQAETRQIAIKTEIVPVLVRGHHDSLVQLLGILLDNAIKYGPKKGTVVVGGQRQDGGYVLWVQDEGPGIDEKDLPYIFDRLYRGDKARTSKQGYGLGLSLAKAIAVANGAEIRATNASDGGACLMVRLPVVK
jgi:two-component system, OmpR family, sensor histidine kinase CiaH